MSSNRTPATESATADSMSAVTRNSYGRFAAATIVTGIVAATATYGTVSVALAAWALFVGWVAWFTRPQSTVQGVYAILCVWLGLIAAALGRLSVEALAPTLGDAALPLSVFVLASVAVVLREVPVVNNTLCWFLGMIAFFAAEPADIPTGLGELAAATAIGGLAGLVCLRLNRPFENA